MKKITLLNLVFLLFSVSLFSQTNLQKAQNYIASKGEVCLVFKANSEAQFKEIAEFLPIGHKVNKETLEIEAYANAETFPQFLSYGLPYTVNKSDNEFTPENSTDNVNAWDTTWDAYPTYSQYVAKMNYYATTYPNLCSLQTIGTTPNGRALLVLKISDNVAQDEAEPEFLYSSTMHGDELTGYPLMIRLIDYLLSNYGSDSEVTNLVNSTEIYINPLANPDGSYRSTGNNTISNPIRANANGQDLNRNYPDNVAGLHDNGTTYQPETKAFMAFADSRDFVLVANFHGGTEVVNYPYDNTFTDHADADYYEYISVEYADNVHNVSPSTYMDIDYDSSVHPSPGVTQGARWYQVYGGRQDYTNYYQHAKEVTIELSNTKWINGNQLPTHWNYNKQAFLDYIKQVNYGFQGVITDESGNPVVAQVKIAGHDALNSYVFSNPDNGDYYRLVKGGTYSVTYSAPGYVSQTINVTVTDNTKTVQNVIMVATTPLPTASDTQTCYNETASLTASGTGTLNWYANQNDTTPLYTGTNFTTPALTSNTSYYVEDMISKANVGDTHYNSGGGFIGNSPQRYLVFNCTESVMLQQVTTNISSSSGAYDIEVELQNSSGQMLDAKVFSLSGNGVHTLDLNFILPVANGLKLVQKNLSSNTNMYRYSSPNYPYTNGSVTITGSSNNSYYYTFFDWKIGALKSARTQVDVTVNPKAVANFTYVVNPSDNGEVTFTNTSTDATTYAWDFGDSIGSSTSTNPVYTFAATGDYDVQLTSTNPNCGDDTTTIQVSVTVTTLGLADNTLNTIAVYPNPFNTSVMIKVPSNQNSEYSIELYDVSGRSIINYDNITPINNTITLSNLNTLSNGIYFMKIMDTDTQNFVTKRLVKQ